MKLTLDEVEIIERLRYEKRIYNGALNDVLELLKESFQLEDTYGIQEITKPILTLWK